MKLEVVRFGHGKEDTIGLLMINGKFECFTLEDQLQTKKVYGETRIPEGTYRVEFRKEGGFHHRYLNKFGSEFHKGMLQIKDVPGFEYVLIHIGNEDDDTAGCLLVGNSVDQNVTRDAHLLQSTPAYKRIYPDIAAALINGDVVTINIYSIGQL